VIRVDSALPDDDAIARAAAIIRNGGLVAFPTETVYGLGAHALDRHAVTRIFDAKGRPSTDPLIVHVASFDAITPLTRDVPALAATLAGRFWPGPLTMVLPKSALVPDEVTAGLGTVAVRVPAHPVARALILKAGVPVAAPSANLFSRPSPTSAAHVLEDLDGRIDAILDGGTTTFGVESTVIDLSGSIPTVLRPGAVTLAALRQVTEVASVAEVAVGRASTERFVNDETTPPPGLEGALPSPGMLDKHYSPRAPLTLYTGTSDTVVSTLIADARRLRDDGVRSIGILAATEDLQRLPSGHGYVTADLGRRAELETIATRLYACLRQLDAAGVDVILASDVPADEGLGAAIHDRLTRAAAGRIKRG
jgi:L-threonylcarbamoyladenylate synthase